MRLVSVDNLSSDMIIAKPVYHQGTILLNTGVGNLFRYSKRLKNMGINYIYVNDKKSEGIEINDVIKEETRQKSRTVIKDTLQKFYFTNQLVVDKVNDVIADIVDQIFHSDQLCFNLVDIKSFDSYTFDHSVNVAVLATLLGKSLKYDRQRLIKLGIGAILHDIGKTLIPEEILNKPGKLTDEEFNVIKEHASLGYYRLQDNDLISPLSRTAILSHHERIDGTGYPKGLKGDDIHDFARIVAVVDVFDALTADRVYRQSWPVNKAVNFLISKSGEEFDEKILKTFIRNIALYPNGTMISLSNGSKAIVKEQNDNYPTRPIVRVIEDNEGKEIEEIVDLLDALNLVIVGSDH